jgi:glutathione synthase/RimK-type ligase-like ATP-grasp enzyme
MDIAPQAPAAAIDMQQPQPARSRHGVQVGIVYHGDDERRRTAIPANSKVPSVFPALAAEGMEGVPVVYHDDFRMEVAAQLRALDAALVWVNPIEAGCDRTLLDALLREVAAQGVYVSTHPDVILKLGTKQVLIDTQSMSWSAPGMRVHRTVDALREALKAQVRAGETRVLKQYRGHSGQGVFKVEPHGDGLRVREAPRGSPEQRLSVEAFAAHCAPYFAGDGRMVDQPYLPRLPEGMIRCYLVGDKVEGFGHQAVNALCPAPAGGPVDAFPPTTTRLYHPPDLPAFQALKRQLETEWVPELLRLMQFTRDELPVLWDCDFLLGEKTPDGADSYVLCEINVSSVSPFPESVLAPLARVVAARLRDRAASRPRGA